MGALPALQRAEVDSRGLSGETKQRESYFLSDLIYQAVDFYAMDKPSIVSGKILTDQTDRTDRLQGLQIRDDPNFFRRRLMKLRAEAMEKGIEIPEIRQQQRSMGQRPRNGREAASA